MADPVGGLGLGAGGGAAAAALVYIFDRILGSGKVVKTLDESFKDFRESLEDDLMDLRRLAERNTSFAEKLHDWHDIQDPEDPAGKIWYFSVGLRKILASMQNGVDKLLELLGKLIQRFDRYNETTIKLISVVEQLQKDVASLGALIRDDRRGG